MNQRLARLLPGHEIVHARQMGWARLFNGDLIAVAEAEGFDVMVTADKNMRYQQSIVGRKIVVIVLDALFIKWAHIDPLAPQVSAVLDGQPQPGEFVVVGPEKP